MHLWLFNIIGPQYMTTLGYEGRGTNDSDWLLACHMAANNGLWVGSHQRGWDF